MKIFFFGEGLTSKHFSEVVFNLKTQMDAFKLVKKKNEKKKT